MRYESAKTNYLQAVAEKKEEKRENIVEKKMRATRGQINRLKAKDESVLDLKRQINQLSTNRVMSDRSDIRCPIPCFVLLQLMNTKKKLENLKKNLMFSDISFFA